MIKPNSYIVLLASGTGSRFGGDIPKQFVQINGRMLIEYTIENCLKSEKVEEIVIVVSEPYIECMNKLILDKRYAKKISVVAGGSTRQQSSYNGIMAIRDVNAKVLIHNAVQPFISTSTIDRCVDALDTYDAVTVGSPSVYTVLELNDSRELQRIVDRAHSVNDLGPECFNLPFLRRIFEMSKGDAGFTNLTAFVMKYNLGTVYVVDGDPDNFKVTYKHDLALAKVMLSECAKGEVK